MDLLDILLIILGWGAAAILLLSIALFRARRLGFRPTPREEATQKTCGRCRLPFYKASWRCGRCGAYLKPRLFYWIYRGVIGPLLTLLVVPWIVAVGSLLSLGLWVTSNLLPEFRGRFEAVTNRLGAWVAPLFERWVPERWRVRSIGFEVEPEEVDAPVDVLAASALTLGACLLDRQNELLIVTVPGPTEETLQELRNAPGGIHEVWGYISDGHPLAPNFRDRIVEARFKGEDLLEYAMGLGVHLETPLNEVVIRPGFSDPSQSAAAPGAWKFVLRRQPDMQGRYPVRWEIHTSDATFEHIEEVVEDLHAWELLPCELGIE